MDTAVTDTTSRPARVGSHGGVVTSVLPYRILCAYARYVSDADEPQHHTCGYAPDPNFDPVMSQANEDLILGLDEVRDPRGPRPPHAVDPRRPYAPDPNFDPVMSQANVELID